MLWRASYFDSDTMFSFTFLLGSELNFPNRNLGNGMSHFQNWFQGIKKNTDSLEGFFFFFLTLIIEKVLYRDRSITITCSNSCMCLQKYLHIYISYYDNSTRLVLWLCLCRRMLNFLWLKIKKKKQMNKKSYSRLPR